MVKNIFRLLIAVLLMAVIQAAPSESNNVEPDSPPAVVQKLWNLVESGNLATPAGLRDASPLFTEPPEETDGAWFIYSDDFTVYKRTVTAANEVIVEVGCSEVGKIDGTLRFTPSPKSHYAKTSLLFHVIRKDDRWQIVGKPAHWLTVRAAIEQLQKLSENQVNLKAAADRSISTLKTLR